MSKKVKVKEVVEKLPKLSSEPILLRFEHSDINPNVNLGTRLVAGLYESERSESEFERKGSGQKRKKVVVIQGETDMTYVGSSEGHLNVDQGDLRTFIAIRTRKNKMRVFEATPIIVSPYIDGRAHLQHTEAGPKTAEEKRAAAIDLAKAFGSKKKRLALERKEKNQISSENMNDSINTATEAVAVPDEIPDVKDQSILVLAPPCNRETNDLKSVYLVKDILSDEDLNEMQDLAYNWLCSTAEQLNSWRESKQFSDYFLEMWRRLSPKKDNASSVHTAKLVLYTELLICILKLPHPEIRKKFPNLPREFPRWLVDKALENFTTTNASSIRCRPDACKDKMCCYILVLVLLANEFIFDVQLMSTSLQIHINKLLTLARTVGISVNFNSATKEYKARLKLPLPKPIEKRGRARKMR